MADTQPLAVFRYQVAFRNKIYTTLELLQADMDQSIAKYIQERSHQARCFYGKTPVRTFLD